MGEIRVNDIRLRGFHGCMEEEALIGGDYIVNIVLTTDMERSIASDDLDDTVDYVAVYAIASREMRKRSKLIEHVAGRIAGAIRFELRGIEQVTVEVVKLSPPIGGDVGAVSVSVTR
jgi:dihydroneopterin aldolase